MKLRLSLTAKILLLALGNLVLIAVAGLAWVQFRYGADVETLVLRASDDRIAAIASSAALDLQVADQEREDILQRLGKQYSADFYLFANDGEQVSGKNVELPDEVRRRLLGPRGGRGGAGGGRWGPPAGFPPPPEVERPVAGRVPRNGIFAVRAEGKYWIGMRIPVGPATGEYPVMPATLFLVTDRWWTSPVLVDIRPWLLAALSAVAITLLCWVPFLRGLTKSILHVTKATERIAEGQFQVELREDREDEVGQLSVAIHRMADRLALLVHGERRFLGDVAHELCSPIARMQFALGIMEQRVAVGLLDDLREEVQQISLLVEELLQFSKASLQAPSIPLRPVGVASVARRAVEREGAVVEVGIDERLEAMADADKLQRAIGNLIRNAVRYAGADGPIIIAGVRRNGHIILTVSDCGPGLPEEELDKVLAPFYRPELSRTREGGGVGLGLAIVKASVEACGGSVRCRNREPRGLEVEIRLNAAD